MPALLALENAKIESCDLQPGDTWRGMQGKMSLAAPAKKIRNNKKSDNSKPQSQINKCHNEKKRRELENETINQLEELLGTCLAEVKQPDKNGIVREATRQIQEVLNRRRECPEECPVRAQCLSPVQGGEISSTQPQGFQYSELTTLIEALKHYTTSLGWILVELNPEGEIECVTENIKELIHQDRTELYKKSIFSLLHIEDHSKLRPLLRDTQIVGWAGTTEIDKFQAIQARLIDNPNGADDPGLVECVIHCAPVGGGGARADQGRVMCVIRRCTDASPALLPDDGPPPLCDHVVFRLDANFTVLSCEVNSSENLINSPSVLVGSRYLELVETASRVLVARHLRSAPSLPAPPAVSAPFRIRLAADRPWLRVSARSRLFSKLVTGEPDFIMSSHEVLTDDDAASPAPAAPAPRNGEQPTPPPAPAPADFLDFDLEQWGAAYAPDDDKERREPALDAGGSRDEEPNRLRSLLSKKPETNNRILKDLLKQEEEEAATSSEASAPATPLAPARSPLARPALHHALHHQNNSDMLLQMLHTNSDEDAESPREARSQPSALLSQLLQTSAPASNGRDKDYFERMAAKRKFDDKQAAAHSAKRATPDNHQQVTSSAASASSACTATTSSGGGMSPLCQKNQILVSLLAKQQTTPLPPPSTGGIRAYGARPPRPAAPPPQHPPPQHAQQQHPPQQHAPPQQHPPPQHPPPQHAQQQHPPRHPSALSQILTQSQPGMAVNGAGREGSSHLELVLQSGAYAPAALQYASTPPAHYSQPTGVTPRAPAPSGDSEVPADKLLSDILDDVVNSMSDDRALPAVLDLDTHRQIRIDYANVMKNEKTARITAITQSLMQCETATKSRASSSPAPPSYSMHAQSGMSPLGGMSSLGARYEARALAEQHRARLLNQQLAQQMLVSPEAAEQPQSDLGSTINALVSATPPNVSLTRTDYHHLYHPTSQMGQNYGTNKITSSQQNPMLSRQLSVGSSTSGYPQHSVSQHSPAALHTPMTPQPAYLRPPRPQLVGAGYYDESYGGDYRRAPHAPLPAALEHLPCAGGAGVAGGAGGAGGTSEYVRNELRAVVGARAARPDLHPPPPLPPQDIDPLISFDMNNTEYYGGGLGGGGR